MNFRSELHPRDREGRWREVAGMLRPALRAPSPAQLDTEATLARTFGFARPLGKDANGHYLVAAGGQRLSIDAAGKIVRRSRLISGAEHRGTLAARPSRRGTVEPGAHLPQHERQPIDIRYIEPPDVPEGMTLADYRRRRAKPRHRFGKHSPGYNRPEVGGPGIIEPPETVPGDFVANERISKGVYAERARSRSLAAMVRAKPWLSGDIRVERERVPASPGVDWNPNTADIPAFGGEAALARMNDTTLRNLLALRSFPAPRKAQVQAEIQRRKAGGSREADIMRKYGFKVGGPASPGWDPAGAF